MTIIERCGPYGQVILFGDSLTELSATQGLGFNFMPALQNYYMRKLDVINRGFSGFTTRNALKVLPQFMPTPQQARVELLVIFFGANDAVVPGAIQHVPCDEFKENLRTIIRHASVQAHSPAILLITPPPINEYATGGNDRTAMRTRQYAQAVMQVGKDTDTPVLNLWGWMMQQAGWKHGQPLEGSKEVPPNEYLKDKLLDGLHFGGAGYRVLTNQVVAAIERFHPHLKAPDMPQPLPPWRTMNGVPEKEE